MEMKTCFKCGVDKSISEFYVHPQMADGHLNKCKECTKRDSNKHRDDNLEKVKAYDRKRGNLPHRIKAREEYQKTSRGKAALKKCRHKYIINNPERRAAHMILGNRIRDGHVIKPKQCSKCGSSGRIHGHHYDYALPLDVEWLCPKCHRQIHKELNGDLP